MIKIYQAKIGVFAYNWDNHSFVKIGPFVFFDTMKQFIDKCKMHEQYFYHSNYDFYPNEKNMICSGENFKDAMHNLIQIFPEYFI